MQSFKSAGATSSSGSQFLRAAFNSLTVKTPAPLVSADSNAYSGVMPFLRSAASIRATI